MEMPEQQQGKLVNGLRELYVSAIANGVWQGALPTNTPKGFPLTHDILKGLGTPDLGAPDNDEAFEEDLEGLRLKMMIKEGENAYPVPGMSARPFANGIGLPSRHCRR